MQVNVLGTPYEIIVKRYDEEEAFERRSIAGYCNGLTKEIVLCDMHTYKGWEHEDEKTVENCHKDNLRHEIVHAFLNESGLQECSNEFVGAWSRNEEMVDWIALQGEKIYKAWQEVNAL
jgi:hypothetical protein